MPSFFVPTQEDLTAQESPPKKNANSWGSAWGGWAQVVLVIIHIKISVTPEAQPSLGSNPPSQ